MKRILVMTVVAMIMASCGDVIRLKQMFGGDKDEQLESINKKLDKLEDELEEERAAHQAELEKIAREKAIEDERGEEPEYAGPVSSSDANQGVNPYEWLSQRKYSEMEILDMAETPQDLRIWRNAMFARHGYIFKSADLQEFFDQFSWYEPRFNNVTLTSIETHNVNTIKRIEDRINR